MARGAKSKSIPLRGKIKPAGRKPKTTKHIERLHPILPVTDLLERVSDGFVAFDAEMNYTYVNREGGKLLGRKPEDLIGKNYWVEYPEAKGTPFADAYVKALKTQEPILIEDYYEPFDRWFENRIYPSKDGLSVFFTEITGQKKASEKIRDALERLSLAVQSANIGLWDWDLLTNKVRYSPEWKSQLGYEDREISDDFSEWEDRVHPEDLERAKATVHGYIENPYPNFQNEFRMRRKDGSYRWMLAQASLSRDEQGKPIRLIGSHIDITERKRTEGLIQNERDFSDRALESLPGVFYMYDENRRFLRWNKNFETVTGYSSEEIARMNPLDFFAGDEKALLAERIREVFATGWSHVEADFVSKDGARTPYYFTGHTIQVNGKPCLVGVGIDISDRRRAETALRKNEQTFSVIFNKAPFAAGLTNIPDGTYLEANEEFERIFGFTREEIVGKTSLELGMYPDPQVRQRSADMFKRQGFVRGLDARLQTRSGETRDVLINSDLVEIGGEKYILTTANDITERKRAEEGLQRNEQVLRLFVEHSPAAIAMFDREMKYIVASNRYIIDYELGEQNVVGRSHYDIFPEIPERWKEIHRRCLAGAIERAEEDPFPRLSGKMDWIRWEIRPWYESTGVIGGIILFSEVITERKFAEERQKSLSQILEESLNEVYIFAADTLKFIEVNKGARINTGYSIEELRTMTPLELKPEMTRQSFHELISPLLTGKQEQVVFETIHRRKDGSDYHVEVHLQRSIHEGIAVLVAIILDITDRKRAEEELRLSRDRLAELSRRLVETRESEARAIGRELHDQFGQMLTALKINLDMARQLPPESAEKKIAQAQNLVDDLMKRVSRLSLELRPPMLDDLGLIPALLWQINRYTDQTGIQVDFTHSGAENKRFGPDIETTAYRIVQESLTNVARHARAARVRLDVRVEAQDMNIQIEDDGVGFDPQAAFAQNRGLGGMRERVRLLGGSFRIESQPGKGAKKFIQLPLKEQIQ